MRCKKTLRTWLLNVWLDFSFGIGLPKPGRIVATKQSIKASFLSMSVSGLTAKVLGVYCRASRPCFHPSGCQHDRLLFTFHFNLRSYLRCIPVPGSALSVPGLHSVTVVLPNELRQPRLSSVLLPRRGFARPQPGRLSPTSEFGPSTDQLPSGIQILLRWWRRLRPFKTELADLRRRFQRNKEGFDPYYPQLTRYFVRFPFLTDSEFKAWLVTADSDLGEGYSWGEFVRSPRSAPGCAWASDSAARTAAWESHGLVDADSHPFAHTYPSTYPKPGPRPGGKQASSNALVKSVTDNQFSGYGLFRGFISTRVPERGDLVRAGFVNLRSPESTMFGLLMPYNFEPYTHLVIRYRGDGRSYRINILPRQEWDVSWFDTHHFVLYTRGGPYWQIAKIPLSKFFILRRGLIRINQHRLKNVNVRLLSFSLMDQIEGPFALELDYIALYTDPDHKEKFAYEQYDRTGIL
ncbi:putative complex I intermediate-associated protein 30 [Fasciola gigantica]|uniref:Putative complex I intermediate-associated protein 30 n=1 Tax=Fasciola gigantica TaxID=46835 RepID=A0A504Z0P9_FASGI|nr:putative complex I intermediate-associated protein 30 [Fasciola gigantica]